MSGGVLIEDIPLRSFTATTISRMHDLVKKNRADNDLQNIASDIVANCGWKDYDCFANSLLAWVKKNIRYVPDPLDVERLQDAWATLLRKAGDCFALDTEIILQKKDTGEYTIRKMGDINESYSRYNALSYDFKNKQFVFRPITAWVHKGKRVVQKFVLGRNHDSFVCTPDHKFPFSVRSACKGLHTMWYSIAERLSLTGGHRQVLLAKKIPALNRFPEITSEQLFLEGMYLAEGYRHQLGVRTIQLANDDPVVEQRVLRSLDAIGISGKPSKRTKHASVTVHARNADPFLRYGSGSFTKAIPDDRLSLSCEQLRSFVEGEVLGDAYIPKPGGNWHDRVDYIIATSSHQAMLGLRVMHRVLGRPHSVQRQANHMGAGKRPIYRIYAWKHPCTYTTKEPSTYARAVVASGPDFEAEVCDITVKDTHNFVLVNGVIAHNCDDTSVLLASLGTGIGFDYRFVTVAARRDPNGRIIDTPSHVYAELKTPYGKWGGVDAVVPQSYFGWAPPAEYPRQVWERTW